MFFLHHQNRLRTDRAELVARVREAIRGVDDYNGDSDLFTHMAEVAVDAIEEYRR